MKRCIVFCASEMGQLLFPVEKEDYVIAADGGVVHTQALGLAPDDVLGDFDSLGYVPQGALVFPVEKDDTDAMLAVRHGIAQGCREFYFYGCLGGNRLDHTIANLQTLQYLADHDCVGYLVGHTELLTVAKEERLLFSTQAEGIVSLFCMGAPAEGITLQGLKYPMENGRLTAGHPLGVSNRFLGQQSAIEVKTGSVLVLWSKENGVPQREKLSDNRG